MATKYNIELKKPIRGLVKSTCPEIYHTKTFYFKQENEQLNVSDYKIIEIRDMGIDEPWYPYIRNFSYYKEKEVDGTKRKIYYSMPSFYQQEFYNDNPPLKKIEEESPEIVDKHSLNVKRNNIHITDNYNNVEKDNNIFKTPDTINIYDDDNNSITPINWHNKTGRINTYEKISNKNIYIDYIYEAKHFDYRGYWLRENQFVTLNLNTNSGNTYLDIHPYDDNDPEIRPSVKDDDGLNNKSIYFYMKPYRIEDEMYSLSKEYNVDILLHPRFEVEYELDIINNGSVINTIRNTTSISNLDNEVTLINGNDITTPSGNYRLVVKDLSPRTQNGNNDIRLIFNNNKKEIEVDDDNWRLLLESNYYGVAKKIEIKPQQPIRTENLPSFSEFDLLDEELTYDTNKDNEYEIAFEIDDFSIPTQGTDVPTPTVEWDISNDTYGVSNVYDYNTNISLNDKLIIQLYNPKNDNYENTEFIYKENRSTVFHTIDEELKANHPFIKEDLEKGFYDFEDILYIGKVNVTPLTNIEEVETKDIRKRGGGIKEDKIKEIIKSQDIQPALYDYDNIEGTPFPKNNTVVIEMPKEILEENGGYLTEKEVEEKVNKYIALGNLPVIIYK